MIQIYQAFVIMLDLALVGLDDFSFFRFSNSAARNIRYAIERRIKLMPYIITQMKFANIDGIPLIR